MNLSEKNEELLSIKASIASLDSIISYQKEEIFKTESTISRLRACLFEQNAALKMFSDERNQLCEERSDFLKNCSESMINSEISNDSQSEVRQFTGEDMTCEKENKIEIYDMNENGKNILKRRIVSEDCENSIKKRQHLFSPRNDLETEILFSEIKVPYIKNKRIHAILLKLTLGSIYIGGSDGLLVAYTGNKSFRFKTGTTDDIFQLDMTLCNGKSSLLAFTKRQVLVFSIGLLFPELVINLPGICGAFNDGNIVYISLKGGLIKKLNKTNWKLCDDDVNTNKSVRCYFPTTNCVQFVFVMLQDSLLYKTISKKDLRPDKVIKGVTNAKMISRFSANEFICHSDDTVWVLSVGGDVVKSMVFKGGIKLLSRDTESVVVVDLDNTVHVYSLSQVPSSSFKNMFRQTVPGNISALAIGEDSIYIAVEDQILVAKMKTVRSE